MGELRAYFAARLDTLLMLARVAVSAAAQRSSQEDQLAQLRDVRCDPPGLVPCEHLRLPGLILVPAEVDVGGGLPGGVLDAERLLKLADRPGRGEAATPASSPGFPGSWS